MRGCAITVSEQAATALDSTSIGDNFRQCSCFLNVFPVPNRGKHFVLFDFAMTICTRLHWLLSSNGSVTEACTRRHVCQKIIRACWTKVWADRASGIHGCSLLILFVLLTAAQVYIKLNVCFLNFHSLAASGLLWLYRQAIKPELYHFGIISATYETVLRATAASS